MSDIPAVAVPQDEPKPYNPERRFDPQIAIATGSADCAVIFDMFVSFTRSNIRQAFDNFKLPDGRQGVRLSYATISDVFPWLTEKMIRNRVEHLEKAGYLEKAATVNGEMPIYAIPECHWSLISTPAQKGTPPAQKGTPPAQKGTASFTSSLSTSLLEPKEEEKSTSEGISLTASPPTQEPDEEKVYTPPDHTLAFPPVPKDFICTPMAYWVWALIYDASGRHSFREVCERKSVPGSPYYSENFHKSRIEDQKSVEDTIARLLPFYSNNEWLLMKRMEFAITRYYTWNSDSGKKMYPNQLQTFHDDTQVEWRHYFNTVIAPKKGWVHAYAE